MKHLSSLLLILSVLLSFTACDNEVLFSYGELIDNEFNPGKKRTNVGDTIPITIEKAIEIDGDISRNGLHFYYSSNRENGNYDIYLRSLTDITTARVTNHPSRDSSPAVSPNGKYLAFVSNREDPEGDIYVVRVNADRLIKKTRGSVSRPSSLDSEAVNITQFQDPVTRTIRIIRDTSPVWSPDGKRIAYTSKRGNGMENIWIMDRSGKKKKQLTREGGLYPCFSPDGSGIIFISYRGNDRAGEVYTLDLKTGNKTRITNSASIKLYPAFRGNSREIIYTEIARDTNGNRRVDLNDHAVIIYRNIDSGMTYPLTLYSRSSFAARWFPVFGTASYNGVIVYSVQAGENINLNIIPETGIIPARPDAAAQHFLATRYRDEYEDNERYLLALERVHQFHGQKDDPLSRVFTARALSEAAIGFRKAGNSPKSREMISLLKVRAEKENLYEAVSYRELISMLKGRSGLKEIKKAREKALGEKSAADYIPYLTEDLAGIYKRAGKGKRAAELYRYILDSYPDFHDITGIHREYALLSDTKISDSLSPSAWKVLKIEAKDNKRVEITKHLLSVFDREKNRKKRLSLLQAMLEHYTKNDDRNITELLYYAIGKTWHEMGDLEKAEENLKLSAKHANKGYLIYYKSHNLLGDISFKQKKMKTTEKYYSQATKYYRYIWHEPDFREKVRYLITYFEDYGGRYESAGKYENAVDLYKKYKSLMRHLHRRKRFNDLTNKYGPRSYVLWVDAYFRLEGWNKIQKLEKIFEKDLVRARMDFDKALIYGFGYYYSKRALMKENIRGQVRDFKAAMEHIDWAIFLDDSFTDPLILKSWIYQYLELKRAEGEGWNNRVISKQFPKYLWEKNIPMLEKALLANDETTNPENEGNIHLNLANNYSLLTNYPRSLHHYSMAAKFKKGFGSKIEEALFYYHMAYSYWQNGDLDMAREQISKSLGIYRSFITGKNVTQYKGQIYTLYKYFALFYRWEGNYGEAVNWYRKILRFAGKNNVPIDRARYLQEIGYCYREMGDLDTATAYLKRSKRELKKYPDDEKKFKLRFTLLGVLPFSFYNLGPDTAVIGDNKIFSSLDTRNKTMLNRAIREEIYFENRNFRKAIKYLKSKIDLAEQRDYQVDRENMSTSLNNLGFYYFKVRDYKRAMKSFKKAWEYSSKADVNNLEGTFQAIMNLSNLYAYLLDYRPGELKNPMEEIGATIKKIDRYRTRYEEDRYALELVELKESAKAKNREVRQDELDRLREQIKKEAVEIYYTIDIAIGVLNFYKAGLLAENGKVPEKTGAQDAWDHYGQNREIYNLYADSLRRFDNALSTAEKNNNRELMVKLNMNAASCHVKTGDLESAYAAYINAEKIAVDNRFYSLQLSLYNELSNFLVLHGNQIEGKRGLAIAADYCEKAALLVEKLPPLYSDDMDRVKSLYDRYISLLIRARKYRLALVVSEKKYSVLRTMLAVTASPEFSIESDRDFFRSYIYMLRNIDSLRKKISSSLVLGAGADSAEIAQLERDLAAETKKITDLMLTITKKGSALSGLLAPARQDLPRTGATVYRFFDLDGALCSWKAEKGKVTFIQHGDAGIKTALSRALSGKHSATPCIILNETLARHLGNDSIVHEGETLPPFILALSMGHIDEYRTESYVGLHTVRFTGDDKKNGGDDEDDEDDSFHPEYIGYSIIADETGAKKIDHNILFSASFRPTAILKGIDAYSLDSIVLFTEAARYAGIKTVVFTKAADRASMENIIRIAREKTFSRAQSGVEPGLSAISIGYEGLPLDKWKSPQPGHAAKLLEKFNEQLAAGDYNEARILLERWHNSLHREGSQDSEPGYLYFRSYLSLLNDDIPSAAKQAELALAASPSGSEAWKRSMAMKIYILFLSGEVNDAAHEISDLAGKGTSGDYMVFKALLKLAGQDMAHVEEVFDRNGGIIGTPDTLLNRERLLLLYADYLKTAGSDMESVALLRLLGPGAILSDREAVMVYGETGMESVRLRLKKRNRAIRELSRFTGPPSEMQSRASILLSQADRYDSRSPFPLFIAMDYFKKYHLLEEMAAFFNATELDRVVTAATWFDTVRLLSEAEKVLSMKGDYKKALKTASTITELLDSRGLTGIARQYHYRAALSRVRLGKYAEACVDINEGMQGLFETDALYRPFIYLLMDCDVHTGRDREAFGRLSLIRDNEEASPTDLLMDALIESKAELNRLARQKKISGRDTAKLEELFSRALEIIERDHAELNRSRSAKLVYEIVNGIISLKLRAGETHDAFSYAELKKHLGVLAKLPWMKIQDGAPDLRAMARHLPVESIKRSIPENAMLICLIRNNNDIVAWIADREFEKTKILKGAYSGLMKSAALYRDRASRSESTMDISRKLNSLLLPIRKYYWTKKKYLIFSLDPDLESVPVEIIGKKNMLAEKHVTLFLSTLFSPTLGKAYGQGAIQILGTGDSATTYIERIAIQESGLKHTYVSSASSGSVLLQPPLLYSRLTNRLYLGEKEYKTVVTGASCVYVPLYSPDSLGYTEFSLCNAYMGAGCVVVNDAVIQDLNNAYFIEAFFRDLAGSGNLFSAFENGRYEIWKRKEYRHPAYWAGIRVYINRL